MKKIAANKIDVKILFFSVILVLVVFVNCMILTENIISPERFTLSGKQNPDTVITESEAVSVVNLCVIEKKYQFGGMTGAFSRYCLVLSNGRSIYVTKQDFDKYEENRYYDFELIETTKAY